MGGGNTALSKGAPGVAGSTPIRAASPPIFPREGGRILIYSISSFSRPTLSKPLAFRPFITAMKRS